MPISSEFVTGSLRKTLSSNTPGNVHVVPPSAVYPQPPCRKLDATLLNCLQPIVILLVLVGSTEIAHSFAASPMIFWPLASTLTWWLTNGPCCEIIRGDVSSRKMYMGGLSYFSNAPRSRGFQVGASCAEALENATSEITSTTPADR